MADLGGEKKKKNKKNKKKLKKNDFFVYKKIFLKVF